MNAMSLVQSNGISAYFRKAKEELVQNFEGKDMSTQALKKEMKRLLMNIGKEIEPIFENNREAIMDMISVLSHAQIRNMVNNYFVFPYTAGAFPSVFARPFTRDQMAPYIQHWKENGQTA